ncbi:LysR substrate-binding domain-containing protein [Nocardioides sp.]|uniref:LysR substrate-binding domain-containing protein n=1 Tax=Nocardioides sp. TaxID=35761 RepID=UPI0035163939
MELRHLRYFVAVAEERHFGRAAARLHMAQPPLSQQVRDLERELGVQLLERTTRRVDLTAAGAAYLERARAVLAAVEAAGDEARLVAAGLEGRLTLGCVGSATYSLLPRLARELAADLPGIEVSFRGEMLVPDQVEALLDGTIDLGLLRTPVHEPRLEVTVLRSERLLLALPTGHRLATRRRVSVRDLCGLDLIVHSGRRRSVMHDRVVDLCRRAGFEPQVRHEVAETSTVMTLVAGGLGAAVVPEPTAALTLDGVTTLPLAGAGTIDLALAWRADRDDPHLIRAREAITALLAPE